MPPKVKEIANKWFTPTSLGWAVFIWAVTTQGLIPGIKLVDSFLKSETNIRERFVVVENKVFPTQEEKNKARAKYNRELVAKQP